MVYFTIAMICFGTEIKGLAQEYIIRLESFGFRRKTAGYVRHA